MFRRLPSSLPAEPIFPHDFKTLGFHINDKNQIRTIDQPEDPFRFKITNDDSWNEKHKEAVYDCLRSEIGVRLVDGNLMDRVYLPHLTVKRPDPTEPHLPIFCSPPGLLNDAKNVIVVLQEPQENWLMWSRNTISAESGIEHGSPIGLAKTLKEEHSDTGLIVLNPCQLNYSYEEATSMSDNTWKHRPARSAVHGEREKVSEYNRIPGNGSPAEHVKFVFERLISDANWVSPSAKLYIIGSNNGCEIILQFLHDNWNQYADRVSAIALPNCPTAAFQANSLPFLDFLATRGRAWKSDDRPEDAVIEVPLEVTEYHPGEEMEPGEFLAQTPCPVFSTGKLNAPQDAFTHSQKNILAWFNQVASDPDYENPYLLAMPLPDEEDGATTQAIAGHSNVWPDNQQPDAVNWEPRF